jgi:hypothetical protein
LHNAISPSKDALKFKSISINVLRLEGQRLADVKEIGFCGINVGI